MLFQTTGHLKVTDCLQHSMFNLLIFKENVCFWACSSLVFDTSIVTGNVPDAGRVWLHNQQEKKIVYL